MTKKKIETSVSAYNINNGKMNITGSSGHYKRCKIIKDYTEWDFRMRQLAILTVGRIQCTYYTCNKIGQSSSPTCSLIIYMYSTLYVLAAGQSLYCKN